MATVITSSIGSGGGRTYSTIQAWIDACPPNLVTVDQVWRGELYADSEFTGAVTFPAITVDATRYVELTAAAGQSFQDHANVRTNPLFYDTTKGVSIATTLNIGALRYFKLSRVQMNVGGNGTVRGVSAKDVRVTDVVARYVASPYGGFGIEVDTAEMINVIIYVPNNRTRSPFKVYNTTSGISSFTHCAAIRLSDQAAGGVAWAANYGTSTLTNCCCFGYATVSTGTFVGDFNATNLASGMPGANSQHNVSYSATTPFTQAGSVGTDLRPIALTALDGGGTLVGAAPADISAAPRPSAPTIGAWELHPAVGGGISIPVVVHHLRQQGVA